MIIRTHFHLWIISVLVWVTPTLCYRKGCHGRLIAPLTWILSEKNCGRSTPNLHLLQSTAHARNACATLRGGGNGVEEDVQGGEDLEVIEIESTEIESPHEAAIEDQEKDGSVNELPNDAEILSIDHEFSSTSSGSSSSEKIEVPCSENDGGESNNDTENSEDEASYPSEDGEEEDNDSENVNDNITREHAAQLRLRGKEQHDQGLWEEAAQTFREASEGLEKLHATEEHATCRLHEALCRLKQEEYQQCSDACTDVLSLQISAAIQARAHHRRAKAKLAMKDLEGALQDARSAAFLGDRKAVALYGRLMRESSSSSSLSSPLSLFSGDSSTQSQPGTPPSALEDLFQGRNPFSVSDNASASAPSALMQSLLNKSPASSLGAAEVSPFGALGDMASMFGGKSSSGTGSFAKSVLKSLSKKIEDQSTQSIICQYLQNTNAPQLQQLASMAGVPLSEGQASQLVSVCHRVTPKGIQRSVKTTKRMLYVVSVIRKTMKVLSKYRHILVLLFLFSWIKSALLRPLPINKRAAKLAIKEAMKNGAAGAV